MGSDQEGRRAAIPKCDDFSSQRCRSKRGSFGVDAGLFEGSRRKRQARNHFDRRGRRKSPSSESIPLLTLSPNTQSTLKRMQIQLDMLRNVLKCELPIELYHFPDEMQDPGTRKFFVDNFDVKLVSVRRG